MPPQGAPLTRTISCCRITPVMRAAQLSPASPSISQNPPAFHQREPFMRINDWNPRLKPQPADLVDAILARRGGALLNLDKALLWSEPLARGWNLFMGNVRTRFSTDRHLQELAICTVALLTGTAYEYHHHAPDFLAAGGTQAQLDALQAFVAAGHQGAPEHAALSQLEGLVIHYATQMTVDIEVSDALFTALRQHLDETRLVELTTAIAAYNMVARILAALKIEPEAPSTEHAPGRA